MQYIFIELSKFNKKLEELLDQKEAWCYILRNSDKIGEKDHKELAAKGKDMERSSKASVGLISRRVGARTDGGRRKNSAETGWPRLL